MDCPTHSGLRPGPEIALGLKMTPEQFDALMSVNTALALQDAGAIAEHYKKFRKGDRLPIELDAELILLSERLKKRARD